jgi:RNA polymerase sigma-70 factor (ECF subfamily)
MSAGKRSEEYVELIIAHQRRLCAYILTLLPDPNQAYDVLQQTNLVLWRDADRFDEGTNFFAWACRVAYFQVLDYRERSQRDRLRFGEGLLEMLTEEFESDGQRESDRLAAMRECVESLPANQRDLLGRRYQEDESVAAIAATSGRTAGAISAGLYRIRMALLDCIERRLVARRGA